jgi:hypothetical protein
MRRSQVAGRIRILGACGIVGLALVVGCGGGVSRIEVSGEVTFGGKPIPGGRIYFTPDSKKGNQGPQGFAEIREGKFDTREGGRGAVAGPNDVLIVGNDGSLGEGKGVPLFDDYTLSAELPAASSVQKFEVPASAPKTMRLPKRKM